jgi:hypothetical protein
MIKGDGQVKDVEDIFGVSFEVRFCSVSTATKEDENSFNQEGLQVAQQRYESGAPQIWVWRVTGIQPGRNDESDSYNNNGIAQSV